MVEKKYGIAAKAYVQSYLPDGSDQTLVTVKDAKGKYGRILGKFWVFDSKTDAWRMLNDMMIEAHMAVEYHGKSKEEIAEAHLENRRKLVHIVGNGDDLPDALAGII